MREEVDIALAPAPEMQRAGQLVGEIAHDINNLLTVVSGSALRLRARPDLAELAEDLGQIICAAERAGELTRQLLAVDRQPGELALIDLAEAARRLKPTIRLLLAGNIVLDFRHYQPAPSVLMERARFEQILMNLIMNAGDAMAEGGTLTVTTQPRNVSALQGERLGIAPGAYVLMSVGDTGAGIEPKTRHRIFDPSFTTKSGTATGMGLSSIRDVVHHAGGRIDVDTEPGHGTTFRVLLPGAVPAPRTDLSIAPGPERGTVLLAEDEPALRRLLVAVLEQAGYGVLEAADGVEAMKAARRHPGPLELLITDVAMPKLSGPRLADNLRDLRPDLKVLFMSGYNDDRCVQRSAGQAAMSVLGKPFTPADLIGRVGELVAG
jgi:two-component system, cell cycle sensor histidine kinase and response regulator CckA